jgi:amino acid permease
MGRRIVEILSVSLIILGAILFFTIPSLLNNSIDKSYQQSISSINASNTTQFETQAAPLLNQTLAETNSVNAVKGPRGIGLVFIFIGVVIFVRTKAQDKKMSDAKLK